MTTTQQETQFVRPIDRILSLIRTRQYSRGWHAHCPAHQDSNDSLMIWEDESDGHVGIKCWAGCEHADVCHALGIDKSDLRASGAYRPKKLYRKLDMIDLAQDKLLPPNFLMSLGLQDSYTWHTPKGKTVKNVVRIPYHN